MLRRNIAFVCTVLIGFACAPANATDPDFEALRAAYIASQDGSQSLSSGIEDVDRFLESHPNHPAAVTYKGSLKTMMARDSFFPWTKLANLKEGLDLIDEAVEQVDNAEPTDGFSIRTEVLMVSGITNAGIPKMFGRRSVAQQNFLAILKSPDSDRLVDFQKTTIYAWMAVLTADSGPEESEDYLRKARAIMPDVAETIWSKR